nr:unnamed protein product [Callosobruchus analis]
MLIDRVKEALDGIKFKDKGSSTSCTCTDQEQSTQSHTATTDSDKENDCCFIIQQSKAQLEAQLRAMEMGSPSIPPISAKTVPDASRPKTRRCECSEDEHDIEERYRTTPGSRAPPVSFNSSESTSSDDAKDTLLLLKEKLTAISEQATETTDSESEKTRMCIVHRL